MTTLFKKANKKYVPVQDTEATDGLANGSWLVTVNNGHTKSCDSIEDEEGLKVLGASVRWLEEWLTEQLHQTTAFQGTNKAKCLTNTDRRLLAKCRAILGKDPGTLTVPAAASVAREVCKKLAAEIMKRKLA